MTREDTLVSMVRMGSGCESLRGLSSDMQGFIRAVSTRRSVRMPCPVAGTIAVCEVCYNTGGLMRGAV